MAANKDIGPIIASIIDVAIDMVPRIAEMVREGLNDEEIQERLRDPNGVGGKLLERAVERQAIGKRLLGRDPN